MEERGKDWQSRETHSVECDGAAKFSSLQAGHVQLLPLHKRFHLHIMLCLNIMVGMIAILALVAELTMTLAKIVIIVAEVETKTWMVRCGSFCGIRWWLWFTFCENIFACPTL